MKYDLEKRTANFGINVIKFSKKISVNLITRNLISQIIKSATSVGANYCEANNAESKKDFRHKIGICRKEAHETCHWLRMIMVASPSLNSEAKRLWDEAKELTLIFSSIVYSTKKSNKN